MNYKGYKELECYIQARELRKFVSELARKFPVHEKFLLTSQIIDSSRSIAANIAEGYGRYSYADTRHFFMIARESVTETMEHFSTAHDENYILDLELTEGERICELVFKLLNGYISYLDRSKKQMTDPKPNSK